MIFPRLWTARKTISRSRRLIAIVPALAALSWGPLEGQQDSAVVAPAGEVHVVSDGETLWSLAARYFGDPYLWPEIYRLNTLVVEDPHWIYPGEELLLVAREPDPVPPDTVEVVPIDPNVVEFDAGAPPEVPRSRLFQPQIAQRASLAFGDGGPDLYRAVRAQEFYSAGFLTEGEELPLGDVVGAVGRRSGPIATASSAIINSQLEVEAPRAGLYQVGDTLVTLDRRRRVSGWGHVMVPTGLVVVEHVSGRRAIARVASQFELVLNQQYALPIEPFRDPGPVRPEAVEPVLRGSIVEIRDLHPVPNQQDVVFIDVGREAGVTPGDLFDVVREADVEAFADTPEERVATLRIVHVRERSASGILMQLYQQGVRPGAPVVLTHKMPT